jgi:heptosyltransferase III
MLKVSSFACFKKIKQPQKITKILFVTLSNIGDAILTTPTLEALHQLFPNAKIDIICDQRSAIIFKYCPYLGELIYKEKQAGWRGWLKLAMRLRQQQYDIAVDLRTDGLLYVVKANIKVLKRSNRKTIAMHSVQKHYAALKPMDDVPIPDVTIWLPQQEVATNSVKQQRILAIGIGANFNGKIWPAASFARFANAVKDHFEMVFIFGDKKDALLVDAFIEQCTLPTENYCGKLSLLETAAYLENACFFIGNDSGLGHIASALTIPTFTVFGIGQPHRYVPWGKSAMWYQEPSLDINKVKPATIAAMVLPTLR